MDEVVYYEHLINQFLFLGSQLNHGHAAAIWPTILALCYPALAGLNLCDILLRVVMRGLRNQRGDQTFDYMEIFAGRANLTLEMICAGFKGSGYDIVFDRAHNALASHGLRLILDNLGCLKRKGLCWLASFVVLCRHQSRRQASNGWLGDINRMFVRTGNHLMEVSSIIFLVAYLLGLWPVLEQPTSSVMPDCWTFQTVLRLTASKKFVTYMGSLGGPSQKPLQLLSPWDRIALLQREKARWPVHRS